MSVGNTQHLQALSCFMKNAMLMIWLLAPLCFSAISKREKLGKRGHFLQLFCLFVQEERGLLMSNGFERL